MAPSQGTMTLRGVNARGGQGYTQSQAQGPSSTTSRKDPHCSPPGTICQKVTILLSLLLNPSSYPASILTSSRSAKVRLTPRAAVRPNPGPL